MTLSRATIARIAEEQFSQRRAALKRAVDNGDWPGDPANEVARLWLAIAAMAGARLPELQVPAIFPIGHTCTVMAHHIASPDAALAELARARDVAIARAEANPKDARAAQKARDLMILANALGAPAYDHRRRSQKSAA
ncbi:hypothetical protein [Pseudorhodoplanes sp.]|uniref:hypothetical protein n=1 Tax=Pseudorhodoplanes sp. TaxID=1934341 RepID=UPI00391B952B